MWVNTRSHRYLSVLDFAKPVGFFFFFFFKSTPFFLSSYRDTFKQETMHLLIKKLLLYNTAFLFNFCETKRQQFQANSLHIT